MKDNKESMSQSIRLELGDIEIGLNECLTLRAGMEIQCEVPSTFEAKLTYAGAKYANVAVSIKGNAMNLKILSAA